MLKSPSVFDFVIIGVYFFVMILCGFLLSRLNKNDKDYFKASGKIPWPMASLSIFIGSFSAYMFVAAAGQVHKAGLPAFFIYTSNSLGFIVAAVFFAKRYRRTRITSPMEYVEMRFGSKTKMAMTLLQMPVLMLLCGNLLYVLCIFISSVLGLRENFQIFGITLSGLHIAMIFTGVVIVIYTAIGGLWAVIVTDTVQFIIAMVASIFLAVLCIIKFSQLGEGAFIANFQDYVANPPHSGYFKLSNSFQPFIFTFSWAMLMLFSQPGNLPVIQRCACVPNEQAARKCCWLSVAFFLVCPLIWIFPVFLMRQHLPDLATLWPHIKNPAEASYVTLALQLLPNGMIGLVTSAILAASISSMAANFNLISVIFTNDVYSKLFPVQHSDRGLIIVGRIASVAVGILAVLIGILLSGFADAFRTTFTIASHTGAAMTLPLALGLVFKRTPWWTGIVAMITCFITTLSLELIVPFMVRNSDADLWRYLQSHLFEYKVFGAIFVNLAVFVISRLFYNPSNASHRSEELFDLLKAPITEQEQGTGIILSDLRVYRIVAISLIFFAVPLMLTKVFNMTEDANSVNFYAGLSFLGLSLVILWLTDKNLSIIKLVREQKNIIQKV